MPVSDAKKLFNLFLSRRKSLNKLSYGCKTSNRSATYEHLPYLRTFKNERSIKEMGAKSISLNYCRLFSTTGNNFGGDEDDKPRKEPNLMNVGGPQVWPSVIHTIKNWFITKVIIQPYFDAEFNLKDFVQGAKQALVHVSSHLASGTLNALDELVTPEALAEIKENYSKFNLTSRQRLQIAKEDIYFAFPYQIGIILEDDSTRRFAEILVVFHCIYGLEGIKDLENVIQSADYRDRATICNYRFRREFTKGVDGSWMINQLNHYKAIELTL